MKRWLMQTVGLLYCFAVFGQQMKPVQENVGKLQISIDPRIELINIVQTLSTYPFIDRESSHSKKAQAYFKEAATLDAVTFTDELHKKGFGFDVPLLFMLHLSAVPELKKVFVYPDRLVEKARGEHNLERYRVALAEFARQSDFYTFWEQNQEFYKKTVRKTASYLETIDYVKALEEYYNETQGGYHLVLNPVSENFNYGPKMPSSSGEFEIYGIVALDESEDGIPYLNNADMENLLWHEFSHSFVNPLSDKYLDKVMVNESLHEPIKKEMKTQGYGSWLTCVNEHIVRAATIRIIAINSKLEHAQELLKEELSKGFVYIEPLIEALKRYEMKRDSEGITFTDFYPELLSVFDQLREKGIE